MMHITDESPEVSLWYTLTDVTLQDGGGITVSKNSHLLFKDSVTKCFWRVDKTKDMASLSKEEQHACEEEHVRNSVDFELKAGDLVVWDRWMMHKSIPFHPNATTAPRIAYNVRLAGDGARFKLPDFMCSGRPTWEWYVDWDTAVEEEPLRGANLPQLWPQYIPEERQSALARIGSGMTRSSSLKLLFEFIVYKPLVCWLPQKLGVVPTEAQHHSIDVYKEVTTQV
jgi:hypothetical protein